MSTPISGSPMMRETETPPTSGRKVIGWVLICFAIVPLAMAARGEGSTPLWIGGATLAVGGTLAFWPSHKNVA